MTNRKTAPEIMDAVDMKLQLKPYNFYTLDNGVPVYSIDAGAQEVLLIEWVFYAGNWYEDKNIVAATTNFLLKNGTKQKKAFSVQYHPEASPGPHDARYLFDNFVKMIAESKNETVSQPALNLG